MPDRSRDWLRQVERDLEHAEESLRSGKPEWACFATHQAAGKAVKALHLSRLQEAWGHSVARLLQELPPTVQVRPELIEMAHVLDGYYIPARYPNGHPEGAPFEHYGKLQSRQALDYARQIVAFVRAQMA